MLTQPCPLFNVSNRSQRLTTSLAHVRYVQIPGLTQEKLYGVLRHAEACVLPLSVKVQVDYHCLNYVFFNLSILDTTKSLPRCTSCNATYTRLAFDDIEDQRRIGQEALDKANSLQLSGIRAMSIFGLHFG